MNAVETETELLVDRAAYLVDERNRTYRYLRRNPGWRALTADANERNKRHLAGYTRIFPDGRRVVFQYRPPYTTRPSTSRRSTAPASGDAPADPDALRLHDTIQSFVALAQTGPAAPPRGGGWGVPEVLSHLVYWHEHYVRL